MKQCTKCKVKKGLIDFSKRKKGLQAWCKDCLSQYHKLRRKNDKSVLQTQKLNRSLRQERIEQWVAAYLKQHPCWCGEKSILKLEFDHCKGNKEFAISIAVGRGFALDRIKTEIKKCQVMCANCHREKTQRESNSWKLKYAND